MLRADHLLLSRPLYVEPNRPPTLEVDRIGPRPSGIRQSHCGLRHNLFRSGLAENWLQTAHMRRVIHYGGIRPPASPAAAHSQLSATLPPRRRAAEQRDELASLAVDTVITVNGIFYWPKLF